MLRVSVYHKPNPHEYEQKAIESVLCGLGRIGKFKVSVSSIYSVNVSDVAIFWGYRHEHIIKFQQQQRAKTLVMEQGYFGNRLDFVSLGLNGLNGHANFKNKNCPADRWEKHGVPVKDWKKSGEYILITGQVPGDAAVQGMDLHREYSYQASILKTITDKPVFFRRHPQDSTIMLEDVDELHGSLEENLERAHCVVTICSNSALDAVISGVPAICLDPGAMAWPVSRHELTEINDLIYPDRQQWLNNLAYCQWTHEEIGTGEPLERLLCR